MKNIFAHLQNFSLVTSHQCGCYGGYGWSILSCLQRGHTSIAEQTLITVESFSGSDKATAIPILFFAKSVTSLHISISAYHLSNVFSLLLKAGGLNFIAMMHKSHWTPIISHWHCNLDTKNDTHTAMHCNTVRIFTLCYHC